uniref:Evasin n=1 Tax=Amblyomma parvum TaxID=251391 RepID=A0A023FY47_AMBPA
MRALWLLNFGLLVALAASNGIKIDDKGQLSGNIAKGRFHRNETKEQLPGNVAIPGCGDPSTPKDAATPSDAVTPSTHRPAEPSPEEPPYYGIIVSDNGCLRRVLGSKQKQVKNALEQGTKRRRQRPRVVDVKLTVDCKENCNGTYSPLKNGEPCLVADGELYGRRNTIRGACRKGVCSSGHCQTNEKERKVYCYVPQNMTQSESTSVNLAE